MSDDAPVIGTPGTPGWMPGKRPGVASCTRQTLFAAAVSLQTLAAKARYKPFAAWATARNSARPLFMVSSHSAAGSES